MALSKMRQTEVAVQDAAGGRRQCQLAPGQPDHQLAVLLLLAA